MSWEKVKLRKFLRQYRFEHLVQDNKTYKQVTISKHEGVKYRGEKQGREIGRKRQFLVNLQEYPNTLMFVRQGVDDGSIGVAPKEVDRCIATENMPMFSIENIDVEFLKILLKSQLFRYEVAKIPTTGSAQKSIHEKQLLEIELFIPNSIAEQKKIVKSFTLFQSKNNNLQTELTAQQDLLAQLRQSFLQEAIQGILVNQDPKDGDAKDLLDKIKAEKAKSIKKEKELPAIKPEEIPFEIPGNWAWCRLGDICNTITKGSSPKWQGVQYVDSLDKGILFITSKNVDSFKIDLTDSSYVESKFNEIEPRSILKKGDLLTNIVGASIGRTALYDLDYVANINQAVCILRIEHPYVNKSFLLLLMNSNFIIQFMYKMQFAPGRANLSMGDLANFPIPLPPMEQQNRIVKKVDELMSFCDELQQGIQASEEQNELLLQQVLKEALRPKEVKEKQGDIQSLEEKHFLKRKVLATYIINKSLSDQQFGDVKFEKLLHLSDYFAIKRNLGQAYYKQAAGPYDNSFTNAYFIQIETSRWFKRKKLGKQFSFLVGQNHSKSTNTYDFFTEEELKRVDQLIKYFSKSDYEQPEIISTLFAVWNNRMIKQESITDDLLKEDFLNWDPQKIKYKDRLDLALKWMRNNGIIPDGWGRVIEKAKKK